MAKKIIGITLFAFFLITECMVFMSVYGFEMTADADIYPGIQLVGGVSYEHMKQSDSEMYANYNTSSDQAIEIDGIWYPPFPYQYVGGIRLLPIIPNKNTDRNIYALYVQGLFIKACQTGLCMISRPCGF